MLKYLSLLCSHTIYVMSVNFIHEWRDLQLKVDSERQIFERLFKRERGLQKRIAGRNIFK